MGSAFMPLEAREEDLPRQRGYWVGHSVICRLFNTPEGKFYGETWEAVVLDVKFVPREATTRWYDWRPAHFEYLVRRPQYTKMWLKKKEIKRKKR